MDLKAVWAFEERRQWSPLSVDGGRFSGFGWGHPEHGCWPSGLAEGSDMRTCINCPEILIICVSFWARSWANLFFFLFFSFWKLGQNWISFAEFNTVVSDAHFSFQCYWSCFLWIQICFLHPSLNYNCTLSISFCSWLVSLDFAEGIFFFPH